MTDFLPDLGGIFASDAHRRVLAWVDAPRDTVPALASALAGDQYADDLDADDVEGILKDLEADGHVKKGKGDAWSRTAAGLKALQAPVPE